MLVHNLYIKVSQDCLLYYTVNVSEHGKGEADGETGLLSQAMERARAQGRNIGCFEDFVAWTKGCSLACEDSEKATQARLFIPVRKGEIERNRPETLVGTVVGSRKFHQVLRNNN